ncbi:sugar phosphate isomerase/epimerase family protein [Neobacillus niacini]|uniref:sugar phosphate isomerase/epimerase family protein n=1 Tax=Neobacillus niacini TaxID=86668 RepID=UPI0030009818
MAIETGINLSSVQQELSKDYFGTLKRVAEVGYKNIELVGVNMNNYTRFMDEIPTESLRNELLQLGLTVISAQESGRMDKPVDSHDWDSVLAYYDKLNCRSIVLPSVWIQNRDEALRAAEQMNRVGKRMRENGFTLYFHNHVHEFKRVSEETLYDYLIDHTDSEYVRFELDLGWVIRAGLQPVDILSKLGNRCDIVHQKDISNTPTFPVNLFEALEHDGNKEFNSFQIYRKYTAPEDYADLGNGVYDFAETYQFMHEMGNVRYAIVENVGASSDKIQSITNDLHYIKQYI